jgi:hypothetical protein
LPGEDFLLNSPNNYETSQQPQKVGETVDQVRADFL